MIESEKRNDKRLANLMLYNENWLISFWYEIALSERDPIVQFFCLLFVLKLTFHVTRKRLSFLSQ